MHTEGRDGEGEERAKRGREGAREGGQGTAISRKSSRIMPRKSIAPPIGLANPFARSLAHAKMPNLPSIHSPSHVNRNPSPSLPPSHRCGGAKRGAGGRGRGREERVRACILFISLSREARAETFPIPRLLLRLLARDRLRPRNVQRRAERRGGRGGGVPCLLCKSNRF